MGISWQGANGSMFCSSLVAGDQFKHRHWVMFLKHGVIVVFYQLKWLSYTCINLELTAMRVKDTHPRVFVLKC